MSVVDDVLLVLVLTLAAAAGARRLKTPMPVVLAIAGIVAGLIWHWLPGVPPVRVPPGRVLLFFLPPLLTSAAYSLPVAAVRRHIRPIAVLAIGLVLATVVAVAVTAHALGSLSWAAAVALGAIVAPPDPVAATTIGAKTGISQRLIAILEGEGLLNDAIAIVIYRLAVVAAITGEFTWAHALRELVREIPIGIGVGVGVGWLTTVIRQRLDDVTLEAGISLVVPFVAYELAERLGGSGVLAAVVLGFTLQHRELEISSPAVRLATRTVWAAVRFASTALVFFLLGLLLGEIVAGAPAFGSLLPAAAAIAGVVIVLRLAWVFVTSRTVHLLGRGHRLRPGELGVLGWSGMRGVVSLALALALPAFPPRGAATDPRAETILLTFAVIVATLVLQGLTLLPLITRLGVADPERETRAEREIRRRARHAGLAGLARVARERGIAVETCERLAEWIRRGEMGISSPEMPLPVPAAKRLFEAALAAQRRVVLHARETCQAGDRLAERLSTEIDVDSTRLEGDTARFAGVSEE